MPSIAEIAPDVYRLSIYVPEIDLQFNGTGTRIAISFGTIPALS